MGAGNAGKPCTVIIGHKEIEGLQQVQSFRDLEEFSGSSVEILPYDLTFSCPVDAVEAPYSVGIRTKERMLLSLFMERKKRQSRTQSTKINFRKYLPIRITFP